MRTSLPSLFLDLEQAATLRELYPGVPLHIFGPLFAAEEMVEFVKGKQIYDGVVASEIEAVVVDIVEGKPAEEIAAFHLLDDGSYRIGTPIRALTNMQDLPLPAYDLVDRTRMDRFIIQTSRGCPIGCNYCPYFISQGNKFRAKTAERALEEFQHIAKRWAPSG